MGIFQASEHNYKPTVDSKLDHPIALSKELVATHNFDDIVLWSKGLHCQCSTRCILNYSRFKSVSMTSDSDMLLDVLIDYPRSVISDSHLSSHDREFLSNLIINETRRRGFTTAYQWVKSQAKGKNVLRTSLPSLTIGPISSSTKQRGPESSHTFRTISPQRQKKPNQTLDSEQRLNLILQDLLPKAINDVYLLNQQRFNNIHIRNHTAQDVISKLATALIRNNQGWKNPVTTRSTQSITRLESYLDFEIPDEQIENIYNVFKLVIDRVINQTKS